MSAPSDAEVIGRSLSEPEAFGLVFDRHAATLLRFLGRRVGAGVAEGLVGELFRVAFEQRKTFDLSRASALPWRERNDVLARPNASTRCRRGVSLR
jgi:RNA polymerase sigma-70 factor, ECF subfamily